MWVEALLLLLTIYLLSQILKKPSDYPPGPWGLPLIGHIPLRTKSADLVKKLQQTYGDIVSIRLGTQIIVFIYDYKLIKEALNSPDITDRPDMKLLSIQISGEKKFGVVSTSGEHWRSTRRFMLKHLRDLGMGKSKIVLAVQNEATELVNDLKKEAGKAITFPNSINVFVLNVIWQMVANKRYNVGDKEITEFKTMIDNLVANISKGLLPDLFTWMKYLPKFILRKITNEETYINSSAKFSKFLQRLVDEHKKTLDANNPRDFIDAYLIEMKEQENDPSSYMSNEDLLFCISDLFDAGSETTVTILVWSILYLASNPHIQSTLQTEIDEVLPKNTFVVMEDKQRLPYTEAFIHEVLRHSSFISDGLVHMASVDTTLAGYKIPKGAIVMGVHITSHYNPNYFESPEEFRPERFLDSEGKFVNPKEGFLPFGIGKRQCLGESLARMELFIFLTTMAQSLNFEVPPGKTIDLTPKEIPIVRTPKDNQQVLVTIRS